MLGGIMARPLKYRQMLDAAKTEALVALDFYNRCSGERNLESFIVHMSIAWLYLAHAIFTKNNVDYRYWETRKNKRCLVREDGEPKTWELRRCVSEIFPTANDPGKRSAPPHQSRAASLPRRPRRHRCHLQARGLKANQ